MSQVRKDILNGWKEIGGYVCRDKRTVERWEKQRGLPVRRVPGAGRATVYALISEVDEWLERGGSEASDPGAEGAAEEPAFEPHSPSPTSLESQATEANIYRSSAVVRFPAPTIAQQPGEQLDKPAPVPFQPQPKSTDGRYSSIPVGRRKLFAGVSLALAAGLITVLASPVIRNDTNPARQQAKLSAVSNEVPAPIPYRSQVPGVDDIYLRGVYSYEQRTPESLEHSLNDFTTAIERDPRYAPAYAGLANTYNLLREYSIMPDAVAYPKARAAAEHAISLDPRLSQAHASLAFVEFFWSWDAANAEREFRTALELDPSSGLAHHWYGSMLTHEGRYREAIEQLDLAQRLEPTSAAILSTRALALGLSGHRRQAVEMLQDLINETPGASPPHAILATLSKIEPWDDPRFLAETRRVAELRHSDEMLQVSAAAEPAYRSGGESAMWQAILATEERLHPGAANRTYLMVEAEASLGRKEAAFADLEQLARRRDPNMIGIVLDPSLAPLRHDQRFSQLVASVGLPPLS